MSFDRTETIRYEERRCFDCGTFWAVETRLHPNLITCPRCAQSNIDKAYEALKTAEHAASSLRGVVTKLKRGRR